MKKTNRFKEIRIYIAVVLYCSLIILFSNLITRPLEGAKDLKGPWNVSIMENHVETNDAPLYYSGTAENFQKGVYRLEYDLLLDQERILSMDRPVIVCPSIAGNGIRFTFNGQVLGYKGDLIRGEASVWNVPHLFFIPADSLSETNEITIELFSLYEVGLVKVPYLVDAKGWSGVKVLIQLVLQYAQILLIGGLFILGLLFVITGFSTADNDIQKILLGFALFFISIFLLDFSLINRIGFNYIIFKKIVITAQFAALLCFILYISSLAGILKSRISIVISVFLGIVAFLSIVYPGDMVSFRKFYQVAYVSNFVLYIYLAYLFMRCTRHSLEMIIIYSGGFTALILSGHDIVCLFLEGGQVFLGHYGISMLFLSGSAVMILQIISAYRESRQQTARAEQFYAESVRDPLTGVYNRKIIPAVEDRLLSNFSILMFDLDDFKMVNDTYGHKAGDISLKAFTKTVESVIRSNDYLIRMGGDEFIAVLPGCSLATAVEQGEKIRKGVASLELFAGEKSFGISCTMGSAEGQAGEKLTGVLSVADEQMYGNKKNKHK